MVRQSLESMQASNALCNICLMGLNLHPTKLGRTQSSLTHSTKQAKAFYACVPSHLDGTDWMYHAVEVSNARNEYRTSSTRLTNRQEHLPKDEATAHSNVQETPGNRGHGRYLSWDIRPIPTHAIQRSASSHSYSLSCPGERIRNILGRQRDNTACDRDRSTSRNAVRSNERMHHHRD